ncbi:hypothetical protein EVAR_54603_1 [Eumeta japonica]|uniref:Uncharacterized protein n=1 Tax=Eumeta variegata TaxID=151549 RepID=A0A4C1YP15_EUMVA|nr:hypothetical protein EVAR_54603_1 [Eumeta japonica]
MNAAFRLASAPARPPAAQGGRTRSRLNTIIPVSCRSLPKTSVIPNACAVPDLSLRLIRRGLYAFKGSRRRATGIALGVSLTQRIADMHPVSHAWQKLKD